MMIDSHSSKVKEDSDEIVQQFHPIVTQFGFTKPRWDYDPESDILRVQFENPEKSRALQIDHHFVSDSFSANYYIAFLPMNLPYTMTPEMVADAAKAFKPKILYPYHTGETDLSKFTKLMEGVDGVDIRLRKMK